MRRSVYRILPLIAFPVLILFVLLLVFGKYSANGLKWAHSVYNRTVYSDGFVSDARLYDRNKILLADVKDGVIHYSDNDSIRLSTLHVVGDRGQNIATGALSVFSDRFIDFDLLAGVNKSLKNGGEVTLSVDANLNAVAYEALEGSKGTVGVCNYKTGEFLCLISSPSFDPNDKELDLSKSTNGEYLNRLTDGLYTPGSVFKLITAAAAIECIDDIYDFEYECEGNCIIGGNEVICAGKHGRLTFEEALAVSCNCYFAELAVHLGPDKLGEYAEKYGLLSPCTINGVSSASGNFPTDTTDRGTLAWAGIGQADDLICPAAMLRFVAAIAGEGYAPKLTMLLGNKPESELLINSETARQLGLMMNYNVVRSYGPERFPGLELCAKSGTAEVGGGEKPHSWFVGYLLNPKAPLAFVVVVENGGWGSSAAGRIAGTVLQAAVADII